MILPIGNDGTVATPGENAEDTFLRMLTDAEKPSDKPKDEDNDEEAPPVEDDQSDSEETPEDDADETNDEPDEDTEAPEKKPKKVVLEAEADAYVKHKVDGKDVEIPLKDLARLYGQEAALTRKSQETAEAHRIATENNAKYSTALDTLLAKAVERYKPYAEINFLALAKDPDYTAGDLAVLQKAATEAYGDVQFLQTQLKETIAANEQARVSNLKKTAGETWKVLSDPTTGIEGWSEGLYNDIRAYSKSQGIPAQSIDELVDPVAFKLLHKAMLFDKGQNAQVKTVKVDKQPKRIIKSSSDETVRTTRTGGVEKALQKLKADGGREATADAFLALMNSKEK